MRQIPTEYIIDLYISEYDKLKQEQIHRISLRDNLIYASLIAIVSVIATVKDDFNKNPILLVLPIVCVSLGWTYFVNDEKISAIGKYIREVFSPEVIKSLNIKKSNHFKWENEHRLGSRRFIFKLFQVIVNELVFVMPGLVSVVIYTLTLPAGLSVNKWIAIIEGLLLTVLGMLILSYADYTR